MNQKKRGNSARDYEKKKGSVWRARCISVGVGKLRNDKWRVWRAGLLAVAVALGTVTVWGNGREVRAPLVCSRGPDGQVFRATVTVPESQPTGSEYTVRIDSFPSGEVSHFGLKYLFDMRTDYLIPDGTTYVEGSARVVPDTGTSNVRQGARVWHDAQGMHLLLPAHVENGSSYTPPSIEFRVKATAEPGKALLLHLKGCRFVAKAAIVGTVETTCEPKPSPYVIGKTMTVPAT